MRSVFKKLLVFFPLVILLVSVNLIADPAQIAKRNSYEKGIAAILLGGSNVTGFANYDGRLVQKYFVDGLSKGFDVCVVGSCRAMGISRDLFASAHFFNNSVAGATLEDYLAIYEMYRRKGIAPCMVVLGVDPWVFNRYNGQERWKSVAGLYRELLPLINGRRSSRPVSFAILNSEFFSAVNKYAQFFSVSYFQSSVGYLFNALKMRGIPRRYYATLDSKPEGEAFLSDGSFVYSKEHRERSNEEAVKFAKDFSHAQPFFGMGTFTRIDKEYKANFEKFLDYLQTHNTRVLIFLPPFHPYAYNFLKDNPDYKIMLEVEAYIKNTAKSKGIEYLGSYDPAICGLGENDFMDALHLRRKAYGKIFTAARLLTFKK